MSDLPIESLSINLELSLITDEAARMIKSMGAARLRTNLPLIMTGITVHFRPATPEEERINDRINSPNFYPRKKMVDKVTSPK